MDLSKIERHISAIESEVQKGIREPDVKELCSVILPVIQQGYQWCELVRLRRTECFT